MYVALPLCISAWNLCCTKCMWHYHYVLVCGICVVLNVCGTTIMYDFSLLVISILVCTCLCNVPPTLLVLKINGMIHDRDTHKRLRADLVEHIWQKFSGRQP